MFARFILDWEPTQVIPLPDTLDYTYDPVHSRYLPKETTLNSNQLYFDKPHLGWFTKPKTVKIVSTQVPHDRWMGDLKDLFYEKVKNEPQFVGDYLEELYKVRSIEKDICEAD